MLLMLAPKKEVGEKEWLRSNIFYTTCNFGERVCNLMIDGASFENLVSREVVDSLGLKTKEYL